MTSKIDYRRYAQFGKKRLEKLRKLIGEARKLKKEERGDAIQYILKYYGHNPKEVKIIGKSGLVT